METLFFNQTSELKRNLKELEKKLKVTIQITGTKVDIEGEAIDEYEAFRVLDAISCGFSAKVAMMLKENALVFKRISIKDFTRRKDLETVRARVIGKNGQTKRTIEEVSDCFLSIKDNDVGIISSPDNIEEASTAIKNLIRGSKQANVYHFLESMNTSRKSLPEDLGIRTKEDISKFERKKRQLQKELENSKKKLKK